MLSPLEIAPGRRFLPVTFRLTPAEVRAYRQAIGDAPGNEKDEEAPVPPLLLAARALHLLMAQVAIPAGTVHGGQECEFLAAVYADRELRLEASAPRAAIRRGQCFLTLEMDVADERGVLCRGRASLIIPIATVAEPQ